jgi:Zn-dependent peptidase ImmA (M78 family)
VVEVVTARDSPLSVEIRWEQRPSELAADWTAGRLLLSVEGQPYWSGDDGTGVEWTWIEVLEFLAINWAALTLEESCPGTINPDDLGIVEDVVARRQNDDDPSFVERLEEEVYEFLERHDLALSVQGMTLPPLRILRQGRQALMATGGKTTIAPWAAVETCLAALGDAIARHLHGCPDPRAVHALARWAARSQAPSRKNLVRLATGLPADLRDVVEPFADQADLVAAARLAGPGLQADKLKLLLQAAQASAGRESADLERLSQVALAAISEPFPYRQGYEAALAVRSLLPGGSTSSLLDVELALAALGVSVRDINLETTELDAIALLREPHGPTVLVNTSGEHAQGQRGRRATLAHELCHLLLDRDGALPLAEVAGARAPKRVEQRARAFAAELLLPQSIAGSGAELMRDSVDTRAWRVHIERLATGYEVSVAVAAWQVKNALNKSQELRPEVGRLLHALARRSPRDESSPGE